MAENSISEKDALNTLVQIYLSHTSKWYTSVVATLIGSIGFPLLAFNLRIASSASLGVIYLNIFSFFTITFLLATLYFLHKVIYSLQFLEELYQKLKIREGERTLADFRNELMRELRPRSKIFKFLVTRERGEQLYKLHNFIFAASFVVAFVEGIIFLVLIWGGFTKNLEYQFLWVGIFALLIVFYLFAKKILKFSLI